MDRQELLLALALLFLLGVGATAVRLLGARRTGLSLRLQVFIPLAATTLLLSAAFAMIVIDRFTARASLFAIRAAEDEARAIAELAARFAPAHPPGLHAQRHRHGRRAARLGWAGAAGGRGGASRRGAGVGGSAGGRRPPRPGPQGHLRHG